MPPLFPTEEYQKVSLGLQNFLSLSYARRLKISPYYGDTDVWTSFCANKEINWVFVRDHKLKLIYFGNLEHYSDPGEDRELILANVQVFSEDGEYSYDCPVMYISRQPDEITLETPSKEEGEKNGKVNDQAIQHSEY